MGGERTVGDPASHHGSVAAAFSIICGGGERRRHLVEQSGTPYRDLKAFSGGPGSQADEVGESVNVVGGVAGCGDGSGNRMFASPLNRHRSTDNHVALDAVGDHDVDHRHASLGERAGLVEHRHVNGPCRLEYLTAFDDDPELGAATGPHHDGGGSREAQRTRARDDQHRHCSSECFGCWVTGDEPAHESAECHHQHNGDEHPRHPVGETGHRRPAALGFLDEPDDLRQRGVCSHPGGLHHQEPVIVHARTDDLVTDTHLDGDRFARHH